MNTTVQQHLPFSIYPKTEQILSRTNIATILELSSPIADVAIQTSRNQLIDLVRQFNIHCGPYAVDQRDSKARAIFHPQILSNVKELADKLQSYEDRISNNQNESKKYLVQRRDFWLTILFPFLIACIPIAYSHFENKADYQDLKKRIEKLEETLQKAAPVKPLED